MKKRIPILPLLFLLTTLFPLSSLAATTTSKADGSFEVTVSKGSHSETRSGSFGVSRSEGEIEGVFRYFGIEIARIWIGKDSSAVRTPNGMHFSNDPSVAAADASHGLPVPVAFLSSWALGSDSATPGDGWRKVGSSKSGKEESVSLEWLSPRQTPEGRLRIGLKASVSRP